MKKSRQPGDLIKAFQAKKHKLAPALTSSRNPGSMPGFMAKPTLATKPRMNPNAPENYGPAMRSAVASTKVFHKASKKRKVAETAAPKNFGKKRQAAYAQAFGTVPVASTRTRTKKSNKKRKGGIGPMANSAPLRRPASTGKGLSSTGGAYARNYMGYGKGNTASTLAPAMASGRAHFENNSSGGEYIVKKRKASKLDMAAAFKKKRKASSKKKANMADCA